MALIAGRDILGRLRCFTHSDCRRFLYDGGRGSTVASSMVTVNDEQWALISGTAKSGSFRTLTIMIQVREDFPLSLSYVALVWLSRIISLNSLRRISRPMFFFSVFAMVRIFGLFPLNKPRSSQSFVNRSISEVGSALGYSPRHSTSARPLWSAAILGNFSLFSKGSSQTGCRVLQW